MKIEVKKMEHVYKLVCKECEKEGRKQPLYFLEVTKWDINEVTAEGKYIQQRKGRLNYYLDYQCPVCNAQVEFNDQGGRHDGEQSEVVRN